MPLDRVDTEVASNAGEILFLGVLVHTGEFSTKNSGLSSLVMVRVLCGEQKTNAISLRATLREI